MFPAEYKSALNKAEIVCKNMSMSKNAIYDQLTSVMELQSFLKKLLNMQWIILNLTGKQTL